MARLTFCFSLLLLLSPAARAIDSLDWLIADSDLVIRGRVIMVVLKTTLNQHTEDWEEATITVYETLKGPPPKSDQIKVLRPTNQFRSAPWSEDPALFLLVAGRRAAYLRSPDLLEGRYLMLDPHARIIPLMPLALQIPDNVANDRIGPIRRFINPLFNAKAQRLTNPDEILQQSREIIDNQKTTRQLLRPALIDVQNVGPLTVPADENWQRQAAAQLAKGRTLNWILQLTPNTANLRYLQGHKLVHYIREEYDQIRMFDGQLIEAPRDYYKNDQTLHFICAARDDPWGEVVPTYPSNWPTSLDQFETCHHLNRLMAEEVLYAWKLPTAGPPTTSFLLTRNPIPLINRYSIIFISLLLLSWATARRQPLFLRFLTAFCLIMTLATTALWLRSALRYDSLVFANEMAEHEFSSAFGQLHYLILDQAPPNAQPAPRPLSHASTSLADIRQVPHHLNYLRPDRDWSHFGIAISQGRTPPVVGYTAPSAPGNSYSFHLLTLRYPWLIAAFLLLPTTRLLTAAYRARRARYRIANDRCPACNYDLRHHPHRCPECGLLTPPVIHE